MKEEVRKAVQEELRIRRKLWILDYALMCGNTSEACREFSVPRSSFYEWEKAYELNGRQGLARKNLFPGVIQDLRHQKWLRRFSITDLPITSGLRE